MNHHELNQACSDCSEELVRLLRSGILDEDGQALAADRIEHLERVERAWRTAAIEGTGPSCEDVCLDACLGVCES